MSDRHHPHPVIVDNSKEVNALRAFSQEARQPPRPLPPSTPLPAPVPPRLTQPMRPAMFGVAALVGVAVAAVTLLTFTLGSRTPSANRMANNGTAATLPSPDASTGPVPDDQATVAVPSVVTPAVEPAIGERTDLPGEPRAQVVAPPTPAATVGIFGDRSSGSGDSIRNTRVDNPKLPETVDARPALRTVETVVPTAEPASTTAAVSAIAPRDATPAANVPVPPIDPPAAPPASAPAVAAAVRTAGGRTAVESVLQRYATAFSTLDVRAAKDVWPSVNEGGLARAFSTVKEQQVDLGACDIWVTGPTAVASCEGRTRYTPKVGSKTPRSEPRGWTFYLEQDGQQWSIASVVTR